MPGRDSNPRPLGCKSDTLPTAPRRHPLHYVPVTPCIVNHVYSNQDDVLQCGWTKSVLFSKIHVDCRVECFLWCRLREEESYINAHVHYPSCVNVSALATICRCNSRAPQPAQFNCTEHPDDRAARIFRTHGTHRCERTDTLRRKKRAADDEDEAPLDDDIIEPEDLPIPVTPNITEVPPLPTWPTASGITEMRARDECRRVMESYPAYNTCRTYVDMEPVLDSCVLNLSLIHI